MSGPGPGSDYGPSDRPLTIQVRRQEQYAVVKLSGSCTMEVSDQVRHCLVGLSQEMVRIIVLDLSDLDFIDSNGLGGIIAAHLKSRHYRGTLRVVNPNAAIRDLLAVTRLTQLFTIYPDVESAVADIGSGPGSGGSR